MSDVIEDGGESVDRIWSDAEIKPTAEDLENPYVLQLIKTITELDDLVDDLNQIIAALDEKLTSIYRRG